MSPPTRRWSDVRPPSGPSRPGRVRRLRNLGLFGSDRSGRIASLLTLLWVLSLADLCFTLWANAFTPFTEMNPVAAHLLRHGLLPSLIGLKLTTTAIGTMIF